jgi:hypothetical protein
MVCHRGGWRGAAPCLQLRTTGQVGTYTIAAVSASHHGDACCRPFNTAHLHMPRVADCMWRGVGRTPGAHCPWWLSHAIAAASASRWSRAVMVSVLHRARAIILWTRTLVQCQGVWHHAARRLGTLLASPKCGVGRSLLQRRQALMSHHGDARCCYFDTVCLYTPLGTNRMWQGTGRTPGAHCPCWLLRTIAAASATRWLRAVKISMPRAYERRRDLSACGETGGHLLLRRRRASTLHHGDACRCPFDTARLRTPQGTDCMWGRAGRTPGAHCQSWLSRAVAAASALRWSRAFMASVLWW